MENHDRQAALSIMDLTHKIYVLNMALLRRHTGTQVVARRADLGRWRVPTRGFRVVNPQAHDTSAAAQRRSKLVRLHCYTAFWYWL
jgi:hypothetical protein